MPCGGRRARQADRDSMSASRMLRATLAPASRHMRATACSRGNRPGPQTWHTQSSGHRAGLAAPDGCICTAREGMRA